MKWSEFRAQLPIVSCLVSHKQINYGFAKPGIWTGSGNHRDFALDTLRGAVLRGIITRSLGYHSTLGRIHDDAIRDADWSDPFAVRVRLGGLLLVVDVEPRIVEELITAGLLVQAPAGCELLATGGQP